LSSRHLTLIAGLCCAALACNAPAPAQPDLTGDERQLVDLYVRLTILEQARVDAPDSSAAGFRRLVSAYDSVAVTRALDALKADPQRWEQVYAAIAQRLHDLEESPDPHAALREALRPPGAPPIPVRPPGKH
jgi:hypothetical protein